MNENIIISNGGQSLNDCPTSWDEVPDVEERLNAGKGEDDPKWKFDCGFKLDFDGELLTLSSRFYPPKAHYGDTWDGIVKVFLIDKLVASKVFDCQTLEQLKAEVEEYLTEIKLKIEECFK